MPYRRVGKKVLHKKDGWSVKQTCNSIGNAKKAIRLLRGVEHGMIPRKQKAPRAYKKLRKVVILYDRNKARR